MHKPRLALREKRNNCLCTGELRYEGVSPAEEVHSLPSFCFSTRG